MTKVQLIVMSGLPGSGKSTIAVGLSKILRAAILSVDPIEAAMWASGLRKEQTGMAAYAIAQALAAENLQQGLSVIIDAVNPVEAARAMWRDTAHRHAVPLTFIEVVCSDPQVHQTRVEQRVRGIPHMPEVSWADIAARRAEYETWTGPRILLDSASSDPGALIAEAMKQLEQPGHGTLLS